MKAAVLREVGKPLQIEAVAIAKPGPREVLLRVAACGLCHSDLHIIDGALPSPLPAVLGHEVAGVVESVGTDVRNLRPGDHVLACLSLFCGHCEYCLSGHLSLCFTAETQRGPAEEPRLTQQRAPIVQGFKLGGFAEQMLVHEHALVKIRHEMPLDLAAVIGCAVTTGCGAVMRTANVRPGETVAVIGCGGIGLAAINGARIAGAGRIIAIDRIAAKLDLARDFGATDTILADAEVVGQVLELTGGGVMHAFEAIGLKSTVEQSFKMLRRGGTATVIGMVPNNVSIEINGFDLLVERRLQGSCMGSNQFPVDIPRYVDFYLRGMLDLDRLISSRIALDNINAGLDELRRGEVARAILVMDN